jgi:hypothetical protein
MEEVHDALTAKHSNGFHGWFGHPARLTVNGEAIAK